MIHDVISCVLQGKRAFDVDGVENGSDLFHENGMLQNEVASMKQRVKVLQDTVESLTLRNIQLLADHDAILLSHVVSGKCGRFEK